MIAKLNKMFIEGHSTISKGYWLSLSGPESNGYRSSAIFISLSWYLFPIWDDRAACASRSSIASGWADQDSRGRESGGNCKTGASALPGLFRLSRSLKFSVRLFRICKRLDFWGITGVVRIDRTLFTCILSSGRFRACWNMRSTYFWSPIQSLASALQSIH